MGRDYEIPASGTCKRLWVQAQNAQKEKEEGRMEGGMEGRREGRKREREKRDHAQNEFLRCVSGRGMMPESR